jgi:Tfp pilus assembly protein PilE
MLSKSNKGITLVALVITIIVLLILAGISISALTNTGIFQKAKDAQKVSENVEKEQRETLGEYEKELNKYTAQDLVKISV